MSRWIETLLGGGGRFWGYARLALAGLICGLGALFARAMWEAWWPAQTDPLGNWWGLRYLLPALAALLAGLLTAANYARRLYGLSGTRAGLRYIIAGAFNALMPRLTIQDGQPELDPGELNLILQVGGPGYLNVRPGSAVLTERLDRPNEVYGAGLHTLSRLEHIREIISLADQHGATERLSLLSKDGLEVIVQSLQFRFRLRMGRLSRDYRRRSVDDPYPFSARAAHDLAYRRSVNAAGLTPWTQTVRLAVEGTISEYVTSNWFDQSTAPRLDAEDPRQKMNDEMQKVRGRLQNTGTDLLWFDIGNFAPASPYVDEQRVETWGTKWLGAADLQTARSDAYRIRAEKLGRAEAQAELVTRLLDALKDLPANGVTPENLTTLFVMRTAQLLDTMVEGGILASRRTPPLQPPSLTVTRMMKEE